MRPMTKAIAAAACLSLLILQFSGAHVHVGAQGYVGVPETSYSHSHGDHGHHDGHHVSDTSGHPGVGGTSKSGNDYGGARDVSLLDETLTSFKIPVAVLALLFLFAVFPRARTFAGTQTAYPVLSGRHTRWRPPLRAPPRAA